MTDMTLRPSQSLGADRETPMKHKLDRFGFILNMDSHGNVHEHDEPEPIRTFAAQKRVDVRTRKWNVMLFGTGSNSTKTSNRKFMGSLHHRKLKSRLRKGVPDTQRAAVWCRLAGVAEKIKTHPGTYKRLVQQSVLQNPRYHFVVGSGMPSSTSPTPTKTSFRNIQETIERDIHRTFPRHSMFFERVQEEAEEDENDPERSPTDICGTTEISDMIRELERSQRLLDTPQEPSAHPDHVPASRVLEGRGGQASLRRVLKAYSLYDREIGYCQGMNFIAGMFLTLMTEEEAFWLLVAVMNDKPCCMRGLFGEGMRETHQVLYVAEKLIHQFLPKLARHFDKEHLHITMFATQWLLTQFTSSFPFELVTRVWDCFLQEGWKITYRVMLALLSTNQSNILQHGFEEILALFRELPDRVEGSIVLEAALKIPLRSSQILKYEQEWQQSHPLS
jgi:hypothetical protein